MIKKLLLTVLVLAVSVTGVQAVTINVSGTYDAPNELDFFNFTNNSTGDVQLVMDTGSDGFDADMAIWTKVPGSTQAGLPDNSDWALVSWSPAAFRPENNPNLGYGSNDVGVENGSNVFGIAYKNGYIPGDLLAQGDSDPGVFLAGLAAGDYLISVTGGFNTPQGGGVAGDLMSIGFGGFESFNTTQTYPHGYSIDITGDVSVSAVPVPAAVWLFGTAIAGLGAVRRKTAA